METIEFQESDGTIRKLVWDSGDESVGVAPKWFADDNKWEERGENDELLRDYLLRDYQLVRERADKAEKRWNLSGEQLIAIAEGRETVPLDGGTSDVFVAVQKLYQSKQEFQSRAEAAEATGAEATRMMVAAVADQMSALDLVSRIREAIGDNGRRMQDELIGYCAHLYRDHKAIQEERYGFWRSRAEAAESRIAELEAAGRELIRDKKQIERTATEAALDFSWCIEFDGMTRKEFFTMARKALLGEDGDA